VTGLPEFLSVSPVNHRYQGEKGFRFFNKTLEELLAFDYQNKV